MGSRRVRGVLPLGPGEGELVLTVDWTRCAGHGLCAHLVPELVRMDPHGYPAFLDMPVPFWLEREARQAVEMCPALALRLDTDPKKRGGGKGGPKTPPIPVAAPPPRTGLLGGGPKSISAG